jgi:hypothetical protein
MLRRTMMMRRKKMMRTRMTSDWLLVYLDRLQNLACRIGHEEM